MLTPASIYSEVWVCRNECGVMFFSIPAFFRSRLSIITCSVKKYYSITTTSGTFLFIWNLLDIINQRTELLGIPESMYDHLYPIPEGKENFVKWKVEQQNTRFYIKWIGNAYTKRSLASKLWYRFCIKKTSLRPITVNRIISKWVNFLVRNVSIIGFAI